MFKSSIKDDTSTPANEFTSRRSKLKNTLSQIDENLGIESPGNEGLQFDASGPRIFTAEEAAEAGVEIQDGWSIKITPNQDASDFSYAFIGPDNREYAAEDVGVDESGNWFSISERQAGEATTLISPEAESATRGFQAIYPAEDLEAVLNRLETDEEFQSEFVQDIYNYGRNEDSDSLLKAFFPDLANNPEELNNFWRAQYAGMDVSSERAFVQDYFKLKGWETTIPEMTNDPAADVQKVEEFEAHRDEAGKAYKEAIGNPTGFENFMINVSNTPVLGDALKAIDTAGRPFKAWVLALWGQSKDPIMKQVGIEQPNIMPEKLLERMRNPTDEYITKFRESGQIAADATDEEARDELAKRVDAIEKTQAAAVTIEEAKQKYGALYMFSDEVNLAWEQSKETAESNLWEAGEIPQWMYTFTEWMNPTYMIPIGEGLGAAAQFVSKTPVLGKSMEHLAAGVQAVEKGMALPVTAAAKGGSILVSKAGNKLTQEMVQALIKRSRSVVTLDSLPSNLEEFDTLINSVLVDNWQKRLLQRMAKNRQLKGVIEKSLGYRIIIDQYAMDAENAVARGKVGHIEMTNMGKNLAHVEEGYLGAVEGDPKRSFGFNNQAFSEKMKNRLLPQFSNEAEKAGTLEHVFTHPEMYNLEGIGRKVKFTGNDGQTHEAWSGQVYASRVYEINFEITRLLKKNGILSGEVAEDWIHRVVQEVKPQGKVVNKTVQSVGAEQSFEKARKFETMAAGIQWFAEHPEIGKQYSANIEKSISEYINQAFKAIADKRFAEYATAFGETPSKLMVERFPELFSEVEVKAGKIPAKNLIEYNDKYYRAKKYEAADMVRRATEFQDLINQALSGRTQFKDKDTYFKLKRVFAQSPDKVRRFEKLVKGQASPEDIEKYAEWTREAIESMKASQQKQKAELGRLKTELDAARARASTEDVARLQKEYTEKLAEIDKQHKDELQALRDQINGTPQTETQVNEVAVLDIDTHVERKFGKLINEDSDATSDLAQGVMDNEISSSELDQRLAGMSKEKAVEEIRVIDESVGEMAGELAATYRYESLYEGELMEQYMDEVLAVTAKYRQKYGLPAADYEAGEIFTKVKKNISAEEYARVPENVKAIEFFKQLDEDQRMVLQEALDTRMNQYGEELMRMNEELAALTESLQFDELANLELTTARGQKTKLIDWIRWKYGGAGELPETFTRSEAIQIKNLFAGHVYTKDHVFPSNMLVGKRVKKEYIFDEMADHFGLDHDELIDQINQLFDLKRQQDNLKGFAASGEATLRSYQDFSDLLKQAESELIPESHPSVVDESVFAQDWEPTVTEWEKGESPPPETTKVKTSEAELNIPKAAPGEPEAGLQSDIFGGTTEVHPQGKGKVTQISMEEALKLDQMRKAAGLPDQEYGIKPQIEGIKDLKEPTALFEVEPPPLVQATMTNAERRAALLELKNEVAEEILGYRDLKERSIKTYQARKERLVQNGEGYLRAPFASGRIFKQDFIDQYNRFFGYENGSGILKATADVNGIMRMMKASLDLSVMTVQGLPAWGLAHTYLFVNPRIGAKLMGAWYKALGYNVLSFITPEAINKYISVNRSTIDRMVALGSSVRTVDYFDVFAQTKGIGAVFTKSIDKIPLKPYKRAETAFFAGGQVIRTEMFKALFPAAAKHGYERELTRMLDRLTGIYDSASAGVPLTARQIESSLVWFAPNYTRACLTVLSEIFRGGYSGKLARESIGGLLGAGAAFFFAANYAVATLSGANHEQALEQALNSWGVMTDQVSGETTWEPGKNFMAIKYGDTYYGIGGFWTSMMKLFGNVYTTMMNDDPRYGESRWDMVKLIKDRKPNKDNPFLYWWMGRAAPFTGLVNGTFTNQSFLGYPIASDENGKATDFAWENPAQYGMYIANQLTPMWTSNIKSLNPNEPDREITPGGVAFSVMGGNVNPPTYYDRFINLADKYITQQDPEFFNQSPEQAAAFSRGQLGFYQLSTMQQAQLFMLYPELKEAYEAFDTDRVARNSDVAIRYKQVMQVSRDSYIDSLDRYTGALVEGRMTVKEWREATAEAGSNYFYHTQQMGQSDEYADYLEYLNTLPDANKYGYNDTRALIEYESEIRYADDLYDLDTDRYDYDKRNERIDAFIEKWGRDVYTGILQYMADKNYMDGVPSLAIEKSIASERLNQEYWRLPYKPYNQMQLSDVKNGDVPAEALALWQEYQTLTTENERLTFEFYNPDFFRDYRAEYRAAHPEEDAWLAFFGYGGYLQTEEAYKKVTALSKKYAVSLDTMDLGLPPASLMDNYFEYNRIVVEKGSGSLEAKQYRLDNPEWDEWGQNNRDWKPVVMPEPRPSRTNKLEMQGRAALEMKGQAEE